MVPYFRASSMSHHSIHRSFLTFFIFELRELLIVRYLLLAQANHENVFILKANKKDKKKCQPWLEDHHKEPYAIVAGRSL